MKRRKVKCRFEQIDKILAQLVEELNSQLQDEHMAYVVEWSEDFVFGSDDFNDERKRMEFLKMIICEALRISAVQAIMPEEMIGPRTDPWSRIKGFMALRQSKEDVQSPISATEYEEIKVTAEKAKALDLESVHVNNERLDWTQEQQEELIARKEKDVAA